MLTLLRAKQHRGKRTLNRRPQPNTGEVTALKKRSRLRGRAKEETDEPSTAHTSQRTSQEQWERDAGLREVAVMRWRRSVGGLGLVEVEVLGGLPAMMFGLLRRLCRVRVAVLGAEPSEMVGVEGLVLEERLDHDVQEAAVRFQ
mmetsp:Transcript_4990/g.20452  ORF Transcript_4990/g.20452 Transcript_4990/m.20452 type:complete len:144 (-) Transcript_4990:794-1225(-)